MANRQLSLREKTKSALERITQVEDDLESLLKGIDKELSKIGQRIATLEETMEAVTKSIGTDVIQATIEETRREKQTAQADLAKAEIVKLVEQKILVPVDAVGEDSFIVGHDVDAEGNTVHPGFGHVHFKQVEPKHQEMVKGSKVGSSIPTGGAPDSKQAFVIDQIFTFVPPAPPTEEPKTAPVDDGTATGSPVVEVKLDSEDPTRPEFEANEAIATEGTVVS